MFKSLTRLFKVSIFLLIILSLVTNLTLAKTEWIANSCYPGHNHIAQSLIRFVDNVNKRANGELVIRTETGAVLGYKGPELLEVVNDGLVQISDVLLNAQSGYEPILTMNTLPYFARGWEENKLLLEVEKPIFKEIFDKWNQIPLYYLFWTPVGIWSQKELLELKDFQKLKIRTYDKIGADFISLFGSIPLQIPWPDLYSSLATGLVDSVYTSTPTSSDNKFWEVLTYYLPTNFSIGHHVVTVNKDAFNALDEKNQQILIDEAKKEEKYMWELVQTLDEKKLNDCLDHGMKVTPVNPDILEFCKEKGDQFVKDWLADKPEKTRCHELFEKYMAEVEKIRN